MFKSSSDFLKVLIQEVDNSSMKEFLESFYYECRVKNLTPKTMSGYEERLRHFHNFIRSKEISFEDVNKSTIQSYILSMKDQVSDITIDGRIRVLKLFFNYLQREGFLNNGNPMDDIKLIRCEKKFPKIITPKEMEKVLDLVNNINLHFI